MHLTKHHLVDMNMRAIRSVKSSSGRWFTIFFAARQKKLAYTVWLEEDGTKRLVYSCDKLVEAEAFIDGYAFALEEEIIDVSL